MAFYSGGKTQSKINKQSNLTTRKRLLLDHAVRTNETNVASAWSSLESSKSFLNSVKVQVRAAKLQMKELLLNMKEDQEQHLMLSSQILYYFLHNYL